MLKKIMIIGLAVVLLVATSITAFAVTGISTPAEIMANLTGKTVADVTEQKAESGKTYGEIAYDEGLWEDFNANMLESKKAFLNEKVADGTMTQEKADEIYANILERQENCNHDGTGGNGGMMGFGFGNGGKGQGLGQGQGSGQGRGLGQCRGLGQGL